MFSMLLALTLAAQLPETTAAPAADAKPAKEKKICRADVEQTASRMRKRICLTEAEWAKRDEGASVDQLKNMGAR